MNKALTFSESSKLFLILSYTYRIQHWEATDSQEEAIEQDVE